MAPRRPESNVLPNRILSWISWFIETLIDKANKALAVNWDDELVKATALTKDGAVIHPNFQPKA